MELNKDIANRDKMLFGRYRPNRYKFGNNAKCENIDNNTLHKLIEQNYIDTNDKCGNVTVGDVLGFLDKYPVYKAHGIAFENGAIKIEGVIKGLTNDTVEEF